MPELPEVETFKRYLDSTSLKQKIMDVKVIDNRILDIDKSIFIKSIKGKKFENSSRHGKYLLINLKPKYLMIHFGMTGDLEYYNKNEEDPKYSKVIFLFDNGFNLAYISQRMFGRLNIFGSIEEFTKNKKLGPDAFLMNFDEFKNALKKRTAIMKNALLNQSIVSGIGNIYSDEILFKTKINPRTKINLLSESKLIELFNVIKEVLSLGIEKEGDLSIYPNNFLIPHRNKEDKCPICGTEISRYEISGRHGFFCPKCQKESFT
ncbi:MAG: DNA-formamidopyrimidine glycosylase [Candidatus Hodarchaeota archaeon]